MAKLGKPARVAARKRSLNKPVVSEAKTNIDIVETAIAKKDAEGAATLFRRAQSALDKAVKKGVLKRNNASRRSSRLVKKVNSLKAAKPKS